MAQGHERREADERILKLEIICEQNTKSINNLTMDVKSYLKEDHSHRSEIREAMVSMSNSIESVSNTVNDLSSIVKSQQSDIFKNKIWQSRIMGAGAGIAATIIVVWVVFKFVIGAG